MIEGKSLIYNAKIMQISEAHQYAYDAKLQFCHSDISVVATFQ